MRDPEVCSGFSLRGRRFVELNVFPEVLDGGCEACGAALRLSDRVKETLSGLGSLLYMCCSNWECGETNICRTNKTVAVFVEVKFLSQLVFRYGNVI